MEGKKKKEKQKPYKINIPVTYLYNALKCYPTFLRSWTYRPSGIKQLIQYRFSYGDYTAKVE